MLQILTLIFFCLLTLNLSAQSKDEKYIVNAMRTQAEMWNNKDLKGFMSFYWQSDSLTFIGKKGITRSWNTVKENYEKNYGKDGDDLGKLVFEVCELKKIDSKSYFMVGKWSVESQGKETKSGYFSLVWQKIKGVWKIVIDHTS